MLLSDLKKKKKRSRSNTLDTDLKFYIHTATTKYIPGQMPSCILFTSKCLGDPFIGDLIRLHRLSLQIVSSRCGSYLHISFWLGEVRHNKFSNKPETSGHAPKAPWKPAGWKTPSWVGSNSSYLKEALHSKCSRQRNLISTLHSCVSIYTALCLALD